jgi:AraC-like DNA-binding protein
VEDPTAILHHKILKETKLILEPPLSNTLRRIIENIVEYHKQGDVNFSPIMFYHVLSVIALVREVLTKFDPLLSLQQPREEQLLSYIHNHIYDPAKTQIRTIAEHFNISPKYFSAYFKRFAGVNYRDYLNRYKTSLIEKRISQGQSTLKQIADEFGFIDESHLSHFFKRHSNVTPGEYRQNVIAQVA